MRVAQAAFGVLTAASPSPAPTAPKGGEGVKSGPIGLAIILLLCVAVYFLFKSMSKHLRRVREDFPLDENGDPKQPPAPDHESGADQPAAGVPPRTDSSSSADSS